MGNPIRKASNFVAAHVDSATVASLRDDKSTIAISFVEEQMHPRVDATRGDPLEFEVIESVIASVIMKPQLARALAKSIMETLGDAGQ
ncbi:hypothetical protein [Pseudomonas putida]|uniref:Uncharacterized protein n=1 Tax=Pseudomonas putida TaxID=303 RepID=A0A1X1A473_PSEPU|nr:hypothetical protein [Pseudomonas putida]ORL66655.1 hypothetical protein B7H17_05090 [Pseudomonas putida]